MPPRAQCLRWVVRGRTGDGACSPATGNMARTAGQVLTTLAFGGIMTQSSIQSPVTTQELLVSSLAQTDALAKLLIEKGLITLDEFMQEDCGGPGGVSKTLQSYAAITSKCIMGWSDS